MKAMYFIIATLIMLSLASCTASENDPVIEEETSVRALVNTYGAINISNGSTQSDNLRLTELPGMTANEAYTILGSIRKHEASKQDSRVYEEQKSNKTLLKVEMSETVSGRYTFQLQLNLMKSADGALFYSGYEADCSSDLFRWHLKGFSFSCDKNQVDCYKFETQSFLYFKVVGDGVQYLQVPFKVTGTYNTATQSTSFTYSL